MFPSFDDQDWFHDPCSVVIMKDLLLVSAPFFPIQQHRDHEFLVVREHVVGTVQVADELSKHDHCSSRRIEMTTSLLIPRVVLSHFAYERAIGCWWLHWNDRWYRRRIFFMILRESSEPEFVEFPNNAGIQTFRFFMYKASKVFPMILLNQTRCN